MVPEKHQKLMVHIRRMTERERKKRGEERGGKAGVEVRVRCIYRKKDTVERVMTKLVGVALQLSIVTVFLIV